MADALLDERIESILFGQGLQVDDYFIEQTPVSEVICYKNQDGRIFDLIIDDSELAIGAMQRLKSLGVKMVRLGEQPF
ncbi:uncharacterized protein sS8_3606 [Methylocaldum marinum]|uniref:Uncharacterized protein n=1 Tax=Methylocaldum marinum TaxID=1432792 RepID=A0A250KV44_9GAMM|nr:hypothetical protein [Methylocaldum marinum]BBA35543.1 uncharacterized protein sS8_3606 [Methylocaldum marinum]